MEGGGDKIAGCAKQKQKHKGKQKQREREREREREGERRGKGLQNGQLREASRRSMMPRSSDGRTIRSAWKWSSDPSPVVATGRARRDLTTPPRLLSPVPPPRPRTRAAHTHALADEPATPARRAARGAAGRLRLRARRPTLARAQRTVRSHQHARARRCAHRTWERDVEWEARGAAARGGRGGGSSALVFRGGGVRGRSARYVGVSRSRRMLVRSERPTPRVRPIHPDATTAMRPTPRVRPVRPDATRLR